MTLRDMIERCQSRMDDYLRVYWNDVRLTALANTMQDKLAQEFYINHVRRLYTFYSVKGDEKYEVPHGYAASEYLYYNSSYNREIVIKDGPRAIYGPASDVTLEGWPAIGYIWGSSGRRELRIYPTFNVDGIEILWFFYGWPPPLANDNDESTLPIEWHPSIAEGMINQAKTDDKEMSPADNVTLWQIEVRKLKKLDSTTEFISKHGATYGDFDDNHPRVQRGGDLPFHIQGTGDVIW